MIEGSVRRSGERLRVTVQLVDAGRGYQLWSETFDREVADVLAVQEEIAHSSIQALDLRLPRGMETFRIRTRPTDLEAYDLYMRGRHDWRRRTKEGLELAVDHFQQAVGARHGRRRGFRAKGARGDRAAGIHVPSWRWAYVYASLGEKDRAFESLERAYAERRRLFELVRSPQLDPLRDDPRCDPFLKRMNLSP